MILFFSGYNRDKSMLLHNNKEYISNLIRKKNELWCFLKDINKWFVINTCFG